MKAICLLGKFAKRIRSAGPHGDRSYMDEKLRILSVCDEIITIERYKKWCEGEIVKLPVYFNDNNWEPASDPCECCQKLFSMNESLEYWRKQYSSACRGATYWREELIKLQKEALYDRILPIHCGLTNDHACIDREKCTKHPIVGCAMYMRPLGEVAKCYKQVEPAELIMSDDTRIVCELLEGSGPMTSREIASRLIIRERCVLESIIEARDAGRISLVDGKYSIAKD